MSMPSISSTPSPWVNGLAASRHGHYKTPPSSAPAVSTATPATAAEPLASAIAAALTQLGLIPDIRDGTATTNGTSLALDPPQPRAAQQIQQYRNTTPAFSGLAQALSASSSHAPATSGEASGLATVFQSLWTSLGSSSGIATGTSSNAIPSLPSFLNTLARNLSESGVTGLRGVFVDTVA
ncbi:MAG TPA: hypothetical protein VMA74_19405 [Dyella sp.]|nr:hypothetical protein [Dyella sp.]